jgi:multiple antibiotic resistance protein
MPWADLQLVFTTAFVTLFVMVDPVGMIPIFASLTRAGDKQYRRDMAFKGTVVATLVLVSFAVIGEALLGFFGISMGAFRVAGGLLLFVIAFNMVFETRTKQRSERAEKTVSAHAPDDISVVPLAIPFLSGPGAITATILLMSQQSGNVMGQGAVMAALLLTMVVTYVCLLLTNPLLGVLSQTLITVITRLLGVILAALAVQFVIDGVRSALNLV